MGCAQPADCTPYVGDGGRFPGGRVAGARKPFQNVAADDEPAPSSTAEPPHLLLVQDHADLRAYRTRLLDGDVWRVTAVPDVDHALAVDEPSDLVLSDVMLPGRGGLDLVRLVRSHGQWALVRVGLLTVRTDSRDVAEGLSAGADDYVRKPFEPVQLLARLRTHNELAHERGRQLLEAEDRAKHLETALSSNLTIGMAVGVLMVPTLDRERAFGLLRERSNHTNRKLHIIAETVVLTGELP